ncbi:hypothetical protein BDF14DRAFT_1844615 [Spinellus fusiger]|nr:hypothetical protein BDF14DRAFT_1844615 [Spinellus fusiger]
MSWKGLTKAVSRLPHQLLSKKTDVTKDAQYTALESSFNSTMKLVERLEKEARVFRDSISSLLLHQSHMAALMAVIYSAMMGMEVLEGAVQRRFQQTPAAASQSVHDAEAAMAYCRDEILPELDGIDRHVIGPLLEVQTILKKIQKTMVKREHKLLDYDRHRTSLHKIKSKEERSFQEEKQIFKLEAQLETAKTDYDYLNIMLKDQLPHFLHLKAQLIQPVFHHFYQLQCKVYGMMYARCHELVNANQQHFVTHAMPIADGFQWRKTQRDVRGEYEGMDLLKAGGKAWLSVSGGNNNSKLTLQERASIKQQEQSKETREQDLLSFPTGTAAAVAATITAAAPPPYAASSTSSHLLSRPSPPPPVSTAAYAVALYDYNAQAEGDLSFKKGDSIEIVARTADTNDWWTGRLHGIVGVFPGNYTAEA